MIGLPHKVKVPASVANIDLDRVRRALFKADGNVTKAAKSLKVSSADLRRLTWRNPKLIMDALEQTHRMLDKAEENLTKALRGDHPERALRASMFILSHSPVARERGWCRHGGNSGYDYSPRSCTDCCLGGRHAAWLQAVVAFGSGGEALCRGGV